MHTAVILGVFAFLQSSSDEASSPKDGVVKLFNGKDYTGLVKWLKKTGHEDPKKVFRVTDGMLHFTGEDNGYVATEKALRSRNWSTLNSSSMVGTRTSGIRAC